MIKIRSLRKIAAKVASKRDYDKHAPEPKKIASKRAYDKNPEPKKTAAKAASKQAYERNPAIVAKSYIKNIAFAKDSTAKKTAALAKYHDKADERNAQSRAKYWIFSPHKKTVLSREIGISKTLRLRQKPVRNTMLNTKKVLSST